MIDNLKSNGKTAHYGDIKVLENGDFNVAGVPSPKELQYKKKMDYIPRTVRINEFADVSLRVLAKECEMDINKLICAILEGYVTKYQDQIGGPILMKERVLNFYLDRVEKELTDAKLVSEKKKWERKIRRGEEPTVLEDGHIIYNCAFYRQFFSITILKPNPEVEKACFEKVEKDSWQHGEYCGCLYELLIPEKKWYTVLSILDRYCTKCDALEIGRIISDSTVQKMVDVINDSKTNKTLVRNLVGALKHSDRIFGGGEKGSIW